VKARLLDGKSLANTIRQQMAGQAAAFQTRTGRMPTLGILVIGDNPAAASYLRSKEAACRKTGIATRTTRLPETCGEAAALQVVRDWNDDPTVDGMIVETPLPPGMDLLRLARSIDPGKDVDGFHPENLGLLLRGCPRFVPCTPAAAMLLLDSLSMPLAGLRAVIVGRSLVVGRPLFLLMLERHMTVTVCHSRTADLAAEVARADVVVAAAGAPGLVRGAWIAPGAVVIDVGINVLPDGTITGDVEFEPAVQTAAAITPVPGGVGPVTVALLMRNLLTAAASSAS